MAYQDGVIFQRTESGNAEIRKNQSALRHSERLLLVLVNGVNTYADIQKKLRSLVPEKIGQALQVLHQKGLVVEILFPVMGTDREPIHPDMLENFLTNKSPSKQSTVGDDDVIKMQSYTPMISGGGGSGLAVNTRTGMASTLGGRLLMPDYGVDGLYDADFTLPLDLSLEGVIPSSRNKTKLVHVYPNPERRRRRRSKRVLVAEKTWRLYAYYGLFVTGVFLVLYSVFFRN